MKSETVRLFQTLPHACGYFAERIAQNLVIDPSSPHLPQIYDLALERGYRRAGGHVYHPQCHQCRACVPARIVVEQFHANRSQRRCLRRNEDLALHIEPAVYRDEYFDLYQRYLGARHANGGMDNPDADDFSRFLYTPWSPTLFVELRLRGKLLAVAVTDFVSSGLSAVYTFYEPEEIGRGLGTYSILRQIELARARSLPHLYLGYWIAKHAKMDYKARFRPLQLLEPGKGWVAFAPPVAQNATRHA
jgi:arginine-tRNA-protein transferase